MLNHWLYNIIQQWVNLAVSVKYYLARVADLSVAFSDKKNVFITTLCLHVYFTVYIIFITSLFNVKEVPFNIWQKGETFKKQVHSLLSASASSDSVSGSYSGEKFTTGKRRNVAFRGELTERKRTQLEKSTQRRWTRSTFQS